MYEIFGLTLNCFRHQKCLIYKFPFYMISLMENPMWKLPSQLKYLQILTKDGLEVDGLFCQKSFYVVCKMFSPKLSEPCLETLQFLKNVFNHNPSLFTEQQTLSLVIRMSFVAVSGFNQKQLEYPMEVLEILQYLLKYNDCPHQLINLSLMLICILANKQQLFFLAWNLLRHLIKSDSSTTLQELVGILQLGNDSTGSQVRKDIT